MLLRLHIAILLILISGVMLLGQQTRQRNSDNASVTDSLQDERIAQARLSIERHDAQIALLVQNQHAIQQSIDRIIGMGVGFGSMLTFLQSILVILQWRKST